MAELITQNQTWKLIRERINAWAQGVPGIPPRADGQSDLGYLQGLVDAAVASAISIPGASEHWTVPTLTGLYSNPVVRVTIPPGHYVIDDAIDLTAHNISIEISGYGSLIEQSNLAAPVFRHGSFAQTTIYRGLNTRGGLHFIGCVDPTNIDATQLHVTECYTAETRGAAISIIDDDDLETDITPKLLAIDNSIFAFCAGVLRTTADHVVVRDNYFVQSNIGPTDLLVVPSSGGSGIRVCANAVTPHPDRGAYLVRAGHPSISDVPNSVHLSDNRIGGEYSGVGLLRFDAGTLGPDASDIGICNSWPRPSIVLIGNMCEGALNALRKHIYLSGHIHSVTSLGTRYWVGDSYIFDATGLARLGKLTHDFAGLELTNVAETQSERAKLPGFALTGWTE